ncbi:hypothetical protein GALMADRAFT_393542 [Galerina marginata CBS 339.88]|uniref:Uncharacterized protein n=1 Tax=Galerina marginata (strain CBS 339.88) TaxID=685588 RepID=A0A067TRX3_GALM3|nr:hypothetical protein GALMADRAFT_393542 [Galerina marginata CBS 339.88]
MSNRKTRRTFARSTTRRITTNKRHICDWPIPCPMSRQADWEQSNLLTIHERHHVDVSPASTAHAFNPASAAILLADLVSPFLYPASTSCTSKVAAMTTIAESDRGHCSNSTGRQLCPSISKAMRSCMTIDDA